MTDLWYDQQCDCMNDPSTSQKSVIFYVSHSIPDGFLQIFLHWMQIIFFYLLLSFDLLVWCIILLSQYSRVTFFFGRLGSTCWCSPLPFHLMSLPSHIVNGNLHIITVLRGLSSPPFIKEVMIHYRWWWAYPYLYLPKPIPNWYVNGLPQ